MISKLIISRTDGIGDVILSLPVAGLMKKLHPGIKIWFVGRSYTAPIIAACEHIDNFINWDEVSAFTSHERIEYFKALQADVIVHVFPNRELARIAYTSNIPLRIGTSHRFHHWLYCNRLVHIGRKRSPLHESQLNALLFRHLGVRVAPPLEELAVMMGLSKPVGLDNSFAEWLDPKRFNLILHPKSKGSAREWGLENFSQLIRLLPKDNYKIFISGSTEDGLALRTRIEAWGNEVTDITGKMPLAQFIAFISCADGLVAASTGPLHIAAALGKVAVGLYAPMHPIHPGRWAPLGIRAGYLVRDKQCHICRHTKRCECIESISPSDVMLKLEQLQTQQ
ncbi:MAG TPA: glycosyltransferase family 9 protein [Desulfuromonadales bacterium]|nr:glycosyltransferase family 9 protein [Desulfuromonadales bacterium]